MNEGGFGMMGRDQRMEWERERDVEKLNAMENEEFVTSRGEMFNGRDWRLWNVCVGR
jgi:hypothetical protein